MLMGHSWRLTVVSVCISLMMGEVIAPNAVR